MKLIVVIATSDKTIDGSHCKTIVVLVVIVAGFTITIVATMVVIVILLVIIETNDPTDISSNRW